MAHCPSISLEWLVSHRLVCRPLFFVSSLFFLFPSLFFPLLYFYALFLCLLTSYLNAIGTVLNGIKIDANTRDPEESED